MTATRVTAAYVLESDKEFQRLEEQSRLPAYDYRRELATLALGPETRVLDAGCGSGVVCRYLAGLYPRSRVLGVDSSSTRIERARVVASHLPNLSFEVGDVTKLHFRQEFELVIFRYVLQHLSVEGRLAALRGALAALKPGGRIHVIDVDGAFFNFYPKSAFLERSLAAIEASGVVDLHVGRKLVALLGEAGFATPACQIDAVQFTGADKASEIQMMERRLAAAAPALEGLLGEPAARKFRDEFLAALSLQSSVYFQNRFLVTAARPAGSSPGDIR